MSVKKKRTECHKKSVRKEWIEDLVVSETMKMVMDDEAIEAIVSMLMDLQDRENVNLPSMNSSCGRQTRPFKTC